MATISKPNTISFTSIGIDIGKEVFHLVGFDTDGKIVLRRKIKRLALVKEFEKLPPCIIGMEACLSAHFVSRTLRKLGHEPRIIPAIYVKPFIKGQKNDYNDAEAIAEAVVRLGLKHVVITSVTRDDLADGGAEHFFECVQAVRQRSDAAVELLTPDFLHDFEALDRVIESGPEVLNHNTETVPRLYRRVRGPRSDYRWTLRLLQYVKQQDNSIKTKSGLMLGLGETTQELLDVLVDLRQQGCDFLTLGQYLQPGPGYLPVERFVPPEEFDELGEMARQLGFSQVASGPFVRSSYHAREMTEAVRG